MDSFAWWRRGSSLEPGLRPGYNPEWKRVPKEARIVNKGKGKDGGWKNIIDKNSLKQEIIKKREG